MFKFNVFCNRDMKEKTTNILQPAPGTLLEVLAHVEKELPELLNDEKGWNTLFIDYEKPFVERMQRQHGEYRINLHRIHPCKTDEALYHPHPWPSAVHIYAGEYEMAVGYGEGTEQPPVATLVQTKGEFCYEMTSPDGWHYVRPIDDVVMSVMISGKPWNRESPKSEHPLKPLTEEQKKSILEFFKSHVNRQRGAKSDRYERRHLSPCAR